MYPSLHNSITPPREELCAALGVALPRVTPLPGEQVPQPFRDLLVHDRDMTPTLEAFHACALSLRVIRKEVTDSTLLREVLLVSDRTKRPVAFGVIRIFLDTFDESSRQMILECRRPLGTILASQKISHFSRPTSFFSLPGDQAIVSTLELPKTPAKLFGRYNELFHAPARRLAQVVEILAPASSRTDSSHMES